MIKVKAQYAKKFEEQNFDVSLEVDLGEKTDVAEELKNLWLILKNSIEAQIHFSGSPQQENCLQNGNPETTNGNGSKMISNKQVKYLVDLVKGDYRKIEELVRSKFSKGLYELDSKQAQQLIAELK